MKVPKTNSVIQAPIPVIEYVLAHEVAHLQHPNRGRDFWPALGTAMPDYDERRARLKELGPRMEW